MFRASAFISTRCSPVPVWNKPGADRVVRKEAGQNPRPRVVKFAIKFPRRVDPVP